MKLIMRTAVLCLCLLLPATVLSDQMTASEYLFASTSSEAMYATDSVAIHAMADEELKTAITVETSFVGNGKQLFAETMKIQTEENMMDASFAEEALKQMPEFTFEPTAASTPCEIFSAMIYDGGTGFFLLTIAAFAATGVCIFQIVRINRKIRK